MNKLSQIAFVWKLYKNNTPIVTISKTLGVHREQLEFGFQELKIILLGLQDLLMNTLMPKRVKEKKKSLSLCK